MGTQNIPLQSYNQFLGAMIRNIIANTPLNDVNQGSVLLTILEAAAANDFENSTAILSLLNLLNIGTVSGTDLDNRAADFGLTRLPATTASGTISIFNTLITKQSTSLYVLKSAPIAGQTVLYVNNTAGWAASGTLYVGRGTPQFEGPIAYSSIVTFSTYSQINLTTALQNNHLISDTVINAQGQPDRVIAAGTTVIVPANNQNPEIDYVSLRDAILPAGETEVDNVQAVALLAGSQGNAPINTITAFQTSPFNGAAVSNLQAFSGGQDIETDQQLRDRIIQYPNTLARGTEAAILAAVINVSDSTDNDRVVSAVIQEPPVDDQPAILYIDNGSGLQPPQAGQAIDSLLAHANGSEKFLQTSNYPIARPQVINVAEGPFNLLNNSFLNVGVDDVIETITFTNSDFVNITAAQVAEVVVAINHQSKNFSARLANNSSSILIYPTYYNAEIIQVIPLQSSENAQLYANSVLQFPTSKASFCSLYQNSTLLRQTSKTATLETAGFGSWNISGPGDLTISVDGTPPQDRAFSLSNFPGASSFSTLGLDQWVAAFNAQFAGITATATATQTMKISSNQSGADSSLEIVGGTLLGNMFPTQALKAVGQTGQFILNRMTGNIEILTDVNPGDDFTMGTTDAKGFVTSAASSSGLYDLSIDGFGRPATAIVVSDSTYCDKRSVGIVVGQTLTISNPSGNLMRIMSNTIGAFQNLLPGDFIYIPVRTSAWLSTGNTGLFKIVDRGPNTTASVDTYIDVLNPSSNIVPETVFVADAADLQAFSTNGYPQIWTSAYLPLPAVASIDDIVNSFNNDLINVVASVFQSDAVKLTSTTENSGSIAIPVVIGNALSLFTATTAAQFGNPSPIANLVSLKSLLTNFRFSQPSIADTFLERQTLVDVKSALSANAIPDQFPYSGPYSEIITAPELNTTYINYDSVISFTRGNNRDQLRSIAAIIGGNQVGTQQALARTSLDHTVGDELEVLRGLQISAADTAVLVINQRPQDNTITVPMFRTGQVNSGNGTEPGYSGGDAFPGSFIPTTTEFSATDVDNQPGIDFGNQSVWSTSLLGTNFGDYAVWMRAHNWYASGGVGSGNGAMIIRAEEYGPNGSLLRFNTQYPSLAGQAANTQFVNTPSFTTFSYIFGSGAVRSIALTVGTTLTVTGPYPDTTTNFPSGAGSSGNYFDYTFSSGTFASVQIGDILSILNGSGISLANSGQFGIKNKSGTTVRVYNPSGVVGGPTVVSTLSNVIIFPLAGNTVAAIVPVINASTIMTATVTGSPSATISLSTAEEQYTYAGNATALGYGHNPTSPTLSLYVGLYDAVNWVKIFENTNPNFILKTSYLLQGVSSIYSMDTTPNFDTAVNGELFKLLPITVQNVYHQFTQPALSQLPILTIVSIADDRKNVQIKSKTLGSAGAVDFIGGTGNQAVQLLQSESEVETDTNGSTLLVQTNAFPDSFSVGDTVMLQNTAGVERLNRLQASDTIDVINSGLNVYDYTYNAKGTGITTGTLVVIADSSGSYGLPSGFVWRWTFTGGGVTLADVNAGDLLYAFGTLTGFSQTNQAGLSGTSQMSGFPIVGVNVGSNYVDVVNPFGVAMGSTAISAGGTVQICPTPFIKWTTQHANYAPLNSLISNGTTVSVITTYDHRLNSGESIVLRDSFNVPDGTYGPITVTGPASFTFAYVSSSFSETVTFASVIRSTLTQTRYRLQSLGFNNLVRLSASNGQSPNFLSCGVAVDDYISLSGNTFSSNNNGLFRVQAVDNDSIVFFNQNATDQLNTTILMNNQELNATWISNSNTVTGTAGTFKYVQVGDWVKQPFDSESLYLQVLSLNASPASATSITLGGNYGGSDGNSVGVVYNETNGYDQGVYLNLASDIEFYEGDAVQDGDSLHVQNLVAAGWFSQNNIGTFNVDSFGTEATTYKPFLRVTNKAGLAQSGVQISVSTNGFFTVESLANKFYSIREVKYAVLDGTNPNLRNIYLTPYSRGYKFNVANQSSITHMGKLGYSNEVSIGTDGYIYYTGLLQKVQYIVDGYEPDVQDFPGQRAVGAAIETLPPLPFEFNVSLTITTNAGVNLSDVSNNVKSTIINYVEGLDVGQAIILSQIIANVMQVSGVQSVNITSPVSSSQIITLLPNEKAIISANNISVA